MELRRASAAPEQDLLQLQASPVVSRAPIIATAAAASSVMPIVSAPVSTDALISFEDVFGSPPSKTHFVFAVVVWVFVFLILSACVCTAASVSAPPPSALTLAEPPREGLLLDDIPAPPTAAHTVVTQQAAVTERGVLADNSASTLFNAMAAELSPAQPTQHSGGVPAGSPHGSVVGSGALVDLHGSTAHAVPAADATYSMVVLDQNGNQFAVCVHST